MGGHRWRLPLTIVAAAVAAGAATLILRPRSGLIDPAAVDAESLLQRRRAGPRRRLPRPPAASSGWAGWRSRAARWRCWRCARRARPAACWSGRAAPGPRRRGRRGGDRAGAGGGGPAAVGLAPRARGGRGPLHPVARARGSATWPSRPPSGGLRRASAGRVAIALIRRFPRHWWLPGGGRGGGLRRAHAVPVAGADRPALQPLRAAPARASCAPTCCAWPTAPDVDVGEVYRVDASRRTTAINAYVGGLGQTKRVVLYDNLIEDFPAGPGAQRGGARARPRGGPRPPARAALDRDRGARRARSLVQRLTERFAGGRARRGGAARGRRRCPRWRSPSRW